MRTVCQCEHASHGEVGTPEAHARGWTRDDVEPVATDYGVFNLCRDCLDAGHMRHRQHSWTAAPWESRNIVQTCANGCGWKKIEVSRDRLYFRALAEPFFPLTRAPDCAPGGRTT